MTRASAPRTRDTVIGGTLYSLAIRSLRRAYRPQRHIPDVRPIQPPSANAGLITHDKIAYR